ncbi:MAG: YbaN family protein [Acidimicrobiales bacterium]|nr:YbaN family protein [Acidimicrobiales bacterium]
MINLWFLLGTLFLGLGSIGIFVPLLPTTPLVILAAACFARSSPRMDQRLLDNRVFGPLIVDWNEHRAIPMRAKVLAVTMITVFGGLAIVLVDPAWAKLALGALFLSVIAWLLTRPSPPMA